MAKAAMDASHAASLRHLLREQEVAALATLHSGEPSISMVPYLLLADGRGFVIHVSRLASHTKDMTTHARVSLLVIAAADPQVPAQARARVAIQGLAERVRQDVSGYDAMKSQYIAKFPSAEHLFTFADFSLFFVAPKSARFVAGFAQAFSLTARAFTDILANRQAPNVA